MLDKKKVTELPELVTTPADDDLLHVVHSAIDHKVKFSTMGIQTLSDYQQAYFVKINGDNGKDGLNWENAFADFVTACSTVASNSPSATNQFAISCSDAGIYSLDITVPPYTHLDAPNAIFTGHITLSEGSSAKVNKVINSKEGLSIKTAVTLTANTPAAYFYANSIECIDTALTVPHGIGLISTGSDKVCPLYFDVQEIINTSTYNPGAEVAKSIYINVVSPTTVVGKVKRMYATSYNSNLINCSGASNLILDCNILKSLDSTSNSVATISTGTSTVFINSNDVTGSIRTGGSSNLTINVNGVARSEIIQTNTSKILARILDYTFTTIAYTLLPSNVILVDFEKTLAKEDVKSFPFGSVLFPGGVPQSTQGTQFYSKTITPVINNYPIDIEFIGSFLSTNGDRTLTIAVFIDSETSARASTYTWTALANQGGTLALNFTYTPTTKNPITINYRMGMDFFGVIVLNQYPGIGQLAGGTETAKFKAIQRGKIL